MRKGHIFHNVFTPLDKVRICGAGWQRRGQFVVGKFESFTSKKCRWFSCRLPPPKDKLSFIYRWSMGAWIFSFESEVVMEAGLALRALTGLIMIVLPTGRWQQGGAYLGRLQRPEEVLPCGPGGHDRWLWWREGSGCCWEQRLLFEGECKCNPPRPLFFLLEQLLSHKSLKNWTSIYEKMGLYLCYNWSFSSPQSSEQFCPIFKLLVPAQNIRAS